MREHPVFVNCLLLALHGIYVPPRTAEDQVMEKLTHIFLL